ncbi:MAG: DUF4386 domain-containing protein [Eubacteriales bacterium]|jgi:hypothetical protein
MMIPNKKTARLAGLFFLLMVVFGLFAEIFFREKLFVPADVAITASNILSNVFLYRVGIVSDILMSVCYLFTALVLYKLLASVNKNMAALMVIFAAAGSVLLMFNIQNEFAPLYILSGNDYLSAFNSSQLQSLAMLYYNSYQHGYVIGQVFFALWVLPLGILIYKSGFIPKVFGVLFVIETIFGLLSVIVHFLIPNGSIETILLIPGTIAELLFMLWLLIWGVNESKLLVQKN